MAALASAASSGAAPLGSAAGDAGATGAGEAVCPGCCAAWKKALNGFSGVSVGFSGWVKCELIVRKVPSADFCISRF